MTKEQREYVNTKRHDDFTVTSCPDDKVLGYALIPPRCRFGAKTVAAMALEGALPVGIVLRRYGLIYRFYDGVLFELDADLNLMDDCDVPALIPVSDGHGSAFWETLILDEAIKGV